MTVISKFIHDQLSVWPLAASMFRSLKTASVKEFNVGGIAVKAQHNPCRITSSTAEVDAASIAARPCFLCEKNRPKEQFHIKFEGRKGRLYNIQVNPYPIFPNHLVIARDIHVPQSIWHNYVDMLDFVRRYPEFTVFYNGPQSGASAPDHMHYQACPKGRLPLETAVSEYFRTTSDKPLATSQDAELYHFPLYARGVFCLRAKTVKSLAKLFYRLLDCAPLRDGDTEPRFNLFSYTEGKELRSFVVFRGNLRSHHYTSTGDDHLTMSPGAADVAGMFVAPVESDFNKLTSGMLEEMMDEVTISKEEEDSIIWRLTRTQRKISVGIMSAPEISFEIISDGAGRQKVSFCDGRINYNGALYDELYFDSVTRSTLFAEPSFVLYDVPIGIGFHWERKVTQKFAGSLKFIAKDGNVIAINRIGIENYLLSVISSEMKASADPEFLKAHAVISRSWLLTNIGRNHSDFDVCADDHCQRYQGLTMAVGENVRRAIDDTWGQTLRFDGQICDTRFSKCCGGRTEIFSTCWEDVDYPYLQSVEDPFCNTSDTAVLSKVLNSYDIESLDFYNWKVTMTRGELSELVARRLGTDFGEVSDLIVLERGVSGRIKRLLIKGSLAQKEVKKELAIRYALSESCLRSSAFDVIWNGDVVTLSGRGWGHGVGLCQIGAAVMASQGMGYAQILSHYYPGTRIERD